MEPRNRSHYVISDERGKSMRLPYPVPWDGSMFSAISVRNLRKLYGTKAAVDGLDLEVPRGSFFGFLGPNGAGKTTTIRMLMGLAPPTSGKMEIRGYRLPDQE